VDDIPDRFSITNKNVRLLVMGEVDTGGTGCICPESALLKTLFTHLLFRDDEILILDMYAGVEHLGRATVDFVDALIIVVEPTRRSLGTAKQIKTLANDIGLNKIWLVGNKIESHDDEFFIGNNSLEIPVLGLLSNDRKVMEADRLNIPVYRHSVQLRRECIILADKLVNLT
jgi:CO dehydrogenase maturation factor